MPGLTCNNITCLLICRTIGIGKSTDNAIREYLPTGPNRAAPKLSESAHMWMYVYLARLRQVDWIKVAGRNC